MLCERTCSLLLSQSALKQLVWESLTDSVYQYFEQNAQALDFCNFFSERRLSIQGALQKELLIAPSVEHFKTATLKKSYCYILPVLGIIYLNIVFLLNFWDERLFTGCSTKGAAYCSFCRTL